MHPSQDGTQKKNFGERIRDCLHYFVFELICETGEKTRNVTNRKKYKRLLAEKETKNTGTKSNIYQFRCGGRPFIGTYGHF